MASHLASSSMALHGRSSSPYAEFVSGCRTVSWLRSPVEALQIPPGPECWHGKISDCLNSADESHRNSAVVVPLVLNAGDVKILTAQILPTIVTGAIL